MLQSTRSRHFISGSQCMTANSEEVYLEQPTLNIQFDRKMVTKVTTATKKGSDGTL